MDEYPLDYRNYMLHRIKLRATSPGYHFFICVSDSRDTTWLRDALNSPEALTQFGQLGTEANRTDGDGEVILGYAIWHREGPPDDPTVRAWSEANTDVIARLNKHLEEVQARYTSAAGIDRSVDVERERLFRTYVGSEYLPFARMRQPGAPGYWHLNVLGTSPIARRRGVGQMLTQWGMDRARDEGVPVCINSSEVGAKLYYNLGFKVVDWSDMDQAGRAFIHDPDAKWTVPLPPGDARRWVVRGEDKRRREVDVLWKDLS